jgi:hypothetical protein
MKPSLRVVVFGSATALILSVSGQAQDAPAMPKPSPELKRYEVMVGAWEGSGEMVAQAGAKPASWTSESNAHWALGGFFVEDKARVTFTEPAMPTLVMHSFYGWDSEAQAHVLYGAANTGRVSDTRLHWADNNTLIGTSKGTRDGKPFVDRWVARYTKDSYELRLDRAIGEAPFFTHVVGRFKRSSASPASFSMDGVKPIAAVPAELGKLEKLTGTWKVEGRMAPGPDAPEMPISGTETVKPAMGGLALMSHTVGDPSPGSPGTYESFGYIVWDPADRAYDSIYVSNMGEAGKMEGRLDADGSLIWTTSQPYMGVPSAARYVQRFKDGGIQVTGERLHGTAPVLRDFTAEYVRAK